MFAERIKELRKKNKLTQKQLASKLFIDQTAVSYWEQGKAKPDYEKQQVLATIFNVSIDYLTGRIDEEFDAQKNNPKTGVQIPVLGKVAAGIPLEAIEDIIDYEEISQEMASTGEFFALQINGDSMEPRFVKGDVIVVRKQDIVENGDIAVIMINGDEATVKMFYRYPSGIILASINPAYQPMQFTPEQVNDLPIRILGKVVELRGKF